MILATTGAKLRQPGRRPVKTISMSPPRLYLSPPPAPTSRPSFTFAGSAFPIACTGATPVFVDSEPGAGQPSTLVFRPRNG